MKISSARYLFGQGVRNLWTNRVMSFASFCIIMVSLLLVGFATLFTANIDRFIGGIAEKNEVVVFLEDGTSDEVVSEMETQLNQLPNLSNIEFYSKEQAFEDYKAQMDNAEAIFATIGEESPLPDAFRLRVRDITQMTATLNQIRTMDHIYKISDPGDFVNLLTGLKSTITLVSTAIVVALAVVCLVIISNATRASVFARRKEINIMKYVGATNAFIRIPFFVEGMLNGILAGLVATALTGVAYNKLIEALQLQMSLWQAFGLENFIAFNTILLKVLLYYCVCGALLGAMGSVFSTRKHLKV